MIVGPATRVASADDAKEVARKLQEVQKRLDELRQQERDLLALQEQLRQAESEKKSQYAKVEIRGRLRKQTRDAGLARHDVWVLSFGELSWALDLDGKKPLLAAAERLTGKPVFVTGKVEGRRAGMLFDASSFAPEPVVVVEKLGPAPK